jgi:hypothetical protein
MLHPRYDYEPTYAGAIQKVMEITDITAKLNQCQFVKGVTVEAVKGLFMW